MKKFLVFSAFLSLSACNFPHFALVGVGNANVVADANAAVNANVAAPADANTANPN